MISKESRTCKCLLSGEGEFEILDGRSVLPVNVNTQTCVCNAWQLSGLPCKHAMRAILHSNQHPHKYVSEWYSVAWYKLTYANNIKSIPDVEQWSESNLPDIEPPIMKRGIGRPARNRKRDADEQAKGKRSKTVKCSKCKCFGHNAKTCKGGLTRKKKAMQNKKRRPNQRKLGRA